MTLPIVVGRHPVFVVQRAPAFGRPHPVYLDLSSGTFLRPETGGLTLTGFLDADEPNHPLDPEALGGDVGFDEVARIMERASRCIPALGEAHYQRGYAGAFDITPDWMPILDETPIRGLYVAAGMSGHGFKLSPGGRTDDGRPHHARPLGRGRPPGFPARSLRRRAARRRRRVLPLLPALTPAAPRAPCPAR